MRVLTRGRELAAVHGRGALLADWRFGHHALYFARLPVVASPVMLVGAARADRPAPNLAARPAQLSATARELLDGALPTPPELVLLAQEPTARLYVRAPTP